MIGAAIALVLIGLFLYAAWREFGRAMVWRIFFGRWHPRHASNIFMWLAFAAIVAFCAFL